MIKGIGTDILEISRFKKLHSNWGKKLINRIFNPEEVSPYSSQKRLIQNLAGKFAAKEAISKAFGSGIGKSISFKDISIVKNKKGKPIASVKKQKLGNKIHLSITHSDQYAVAFAVIEEVWIIQFLGKL